MDLEIPGETEADVHGCQGIRLEERSSVTCSANYSSHRRVTLYAAQASDRTAVAVVRKDSASQQSDQKSYQRGR
ncbi:hypothetical protein GCM10023097_53650 [Streptomyces collinus]